MAISCRKKRSVLPSGAGNLGEGNFVERSILLTISTAVALVLAVAACTPTVKVEAPPEPITINLNIKLDAEVRLKIEEQAKDDINNNPGLF
ncbi:MAG: hypothetical protein CMN55_01230 [Sneathiella sp.]|nr:hypothetical protein [Sneathiella sp.]